MTVLEGIEKNYGDCVELKNKILAVADEYFKEEYNIDNYNCFECWRNNRSFRKEYLMLLYSFIKDWKDFSQSPYSLSMYDSKDIDWEYKPEGSLRFSNHWNFYSQGEYHCKIEDESKKNNFMICRYENGMYKIVKDYGTKWEFWKEIDKLEEVK